MTHFSTTAAVSGRNKFSLRFKFLGILLLVVLLSGKSWGQVTLGTSPYNQDFNTTTLPTGWTTRTSATANALGTSVTPVTTNTWASTTGEFRFVASAKSPLTSASLTATQNAATDRCLAVKPTGSFGDPGQAFTFQISNTTGMTNFSITFNAQLSDVQGRTTIYRVEYGLGTTPSTWTLVGSTFTDLSINSGAWGNSNITRSFGTALDNQSGNVWIRISCLVAATGSGSRCTFGIDDVNLSWTSSSVNNPATFTQQSSNTSTTQVGLTASANTNSNNIIVAFNAINSFGIPTDGTSYSASASLPTAGTVIYNGLASGLASVAHTGRAANTAYYYKAWSYWVYELFIGY